MKYKLLQADGAQELERIVNLHLDEGWKLYGYTFTDFPFFFQVVMGDR